MAVARVTPEVKNGRDGEIRSGVTAVYDRHGYDPEKRAALDWWALKLQAILENEGAGKVLAFARG